MVGEDDLYTGWATFMCSRGVTQEAAVHQAAILADSSTMILAKNPTTHSAPLSTPAFENVESVEVPTPDHTPLDVTVSPDLPAGTFVASVQRSGFKRLHKIGSCPRRPGLDYSSFEVMGLTEPAPEMYSQRCKQCFRDGEQVASSPSTSSSEDSPSTSDE